MVDIFQQLASIISCAFIDKECALNLLNLFLSFRTTIDNLF